MGLSLGKKSNWGFGFLVHWRNPNLYFESWAKPRLGLQWPWPPKLHEKANNS